MNVADLLKLTPTLSMAAVMSYAAYSIEPPARADSARPDVQAYGH